MLKEFEFYHGVVFSKLLHSTRGNVSVQIYPTSDNASYVINGKVGIYIKYSSKRLSPWRFSFQKRHQDEILDLKNKFGEVFVLLVCNDDGIVALKFDELKHILNEVHDNVEWISVRRGRREMYSVQGSDGKLEFKMAKNDYAKRILEFREIKIKEKVLSWISS